ncbi:MAG: hypothetical protein LOD89_03670 [Tissierellales bacterium]|jgi:hypothetical protein
MNKNKKAIRYTINLTMLCNNVKEVKAAKKRGTKNRVMEYFIGILLKVKFSTVNTLKIKDMTVNPKTKITYLKDTRGSISTVKYRPNSAL